MKLENKFTGTAPQSTATAKVIAENAAGTTVTVATDLNISGRPAQFGRGTMEDVGMKVMAQFADCLSKTLGG